jgi:hypothetical protein
MGKGGRGWNSTEHAVFIERSLLWAEFIAILPFWTTDFKNNFWVLRWGRCFRNYYTLVTSFRAPFLFFAPPLEGLLLLRAQPATCNLSLAKSQVSRTGSTLGCPLVSLLTRPSPGWGRGCPGLFRTPVWERRKSSPGAGDARLAGPFHYGRLDTVWCVMTWTLN